MRLKAKKKTGKLRGFCIKIRDKSADFVKPAIVATLIAIGTAVGPRLATDYWNKKDQEKQVLADARKAANQLALDITDLLGKRHFYAVCVVTAFQSKKDEHKVYEDYDKVVKEWNEKRYSNYILLKRYFGQDQLKRLIQLMITFNNFHQDLLHIHNLREDNRPAPDVGNSKEGLMKRIYDADDDLGNFSDELQDKLRRGAVDIYIAAPPVEPTKDSPKK